MAIADDSDAVNGDTTAIQILSRGPTIIILSLTTICLPYLFSLSILTYVLLASSLIGIVITASDITALLRFHGRRLKIRIQAIGDDLILDDAIRDVIGNEGWYTAFVGSWVLYLLPLSKELRFRIIRKVCFGNDGNPNDEIEGGEFVRNVLFEPGGIWKIHPDFVLNRKDADADANTDSDDDCGLASTPVNLKDGRDHKNAAETDCDMTWDTADTDIGTRDSTDGSDHCHADTKSAEEERDSVDTFSNTINVDNANISVRDAVAATLTVEKELNQQLLRTSKNMDTTEQIMHDMIQKISKSIIENINVDITDNKLQRIGATAAILLCVQMRYSKAARRTIWNVTQGTLACTLASVAVGTITSAHLKNQWIKFVDTNVTQTIRGINSTSIPPTMPHARDYSTWRTISGSFMDGIRNLNVDNTTAGELIRLLAFRKYGEVLLERFQKDAKFKRKCQGLVTVVVLCSMRHARIAHLQSGFPSTSTRRSRRR